MQITFTHQETTFTVDCCDTVKQIVLYAVPTEYSDDGYFVAHWSAGEIEPIPACASTDAHVLCKADINNKEITVSFAVDGVTCHA